MTRLMRSFWIVLNLIVIVIFSASNSVFAASRQLSEREYRALGAYLVGGYKLNCSASDAPTGASNQKLTSGSKVFILGDSITVRAKSSYISAFSELGITATVDGSSSRSIKGVGIDGNKLTGLDAVANTENQTSIAEANAIVIALGTNGGNSASNMSDLINAIRATGTTAAIYWIDTAVIGKKDLIGQIKGANQAIYSQSTTLNYTTISWYRTVTPDGDPLNPLETDKDTNGYIEQANEHVHPTAAGISALTNLVVSSVASTGTNTSSQPAAGCCTTTVANDASLLGNDNVEKAYNYFVQRGLTNFQAAGLVGNMWAESSVIPRKLQYVHGKETGSADIKAGIAQVNADRAANGDSQIADSSFGFGLVQWTPYTKFVQTSFDAGISYETMDTLTYQLEQVWGQLIGEGIVAKVSSLKSVGDKIKATTDIEHATFMFARYYEVFRNATAFSDYGVKDQKQINDRKMTAADVQKVSDEYAKRITKANEILGLYGNGTVGAGGTIITSSQATGCSDVTPAGQNTRYIDGFTVYSQYDPQWKDTKYGISTIGDAGCGPSAMAMIISTLTGQKVTPVETSNYAAANGQQTSTGGSAWTISKVLAEHWNLKADPIGADLTKITTALRAGSLIMVSGDGAVPFTKNGHFIVLRGLTTDGKFMVGDSAHDIANTTAYDTAQIMDVISKKSGSVYAISK